MKNRFNNLTSKEWLPFQKSWFKYSGDEDLYRQNIRFFIKFDDEEKAPNLLFWGSENQTIAINKLQSELNFNIYTPDTVKQADLLQFVFLDLRQSIASNPTLENYIKLKKEVLNLAYSLKNKLAHRRFISVLLPNIYQNNQFYPVAWDLAKTLGSFYSLKDDKIGCVDTEENTAQGNFFKTSESHFYSLYFRNDEKSQYDDQAIEYPFFSNINQQENKNLAFERFPSWYILKPKPRKKNEILHPAKYPEDLTEMHIKAFTREGDHVFDPMSGTGTTQVSALQLSRNGYGTELSEFFSKIANDRCKNYLSENPTSAEFKILCKDARQIKPKDFPLINYIITSPPYWDMLNMKGAENQAKRIKKGLQVNYSDNHEDLGNMSDYNEFLNDLVKIYFDLAEILKPGGYLSIVVKNIKKKGSNYPFAWDLSLKLQEKYILLPETFWLQDDISIAPYGYGNTFVSNTFHQYCLNFQKPL